MPALSFHERLAIEPPVRRAAPCDPRPWRRGGGVPDGRAAAGRIGSGRRMGRVCCH